MRKAYILVIAVLVWMTATGGSRLHLAVERGQDDTSPGPLIYTSPMLGQTPDGQPGLLPTGLLAPGDRVHRVLRVTNGERHAVVLTGVRARPVSGSRKVTEQMQVVVTTDAAGTNPIAWGSVGEFVGRSRHFDLGPVSLPAGASVELHFWLTVEPGAPAGEYQGVLDFTVDAKAI